LPVPRLACLVGIMAVVFAPTTSAGLYRLGQRFGVALDAGSLGKSLADYPYRQLGAFSWYLDGQPHGLGTSIPPIPHEIHNVDYVPVVGGHGRDGPPGPGHVQRLIGTRADMYPHGTVWQIGNEPGVDCYLRPPRLIAHDPFDYTAYARAFHDWHAQITDADPSYRVMLGAVIPGGEIDFNYDNSRRLGSLFAAYYDLFSQPMPIDVFNLRLYVGKDAATLETFKSAVVGFRTWMDAIPLAPAGTVSYRDSELWLTAYGLAGPDVGPELPGKMMTCWTDWLCGYADPDITDDEIGMERDGDRLVQRWAWFALDDPGQNFHDTRLFRSDGTITPLGLQYQSYLEHIPEPTTITILLAGLFTMAVRARPRRFCLVWKWPGRK